MTEQQLSVREWIALQLIEGRGALWIADQVREKLGYRTAMDEVRNAETHPYIKAARQKIIEARRWRSLLRLYGDLWRHSGDADAVTEVDSLSIDDFRRIYYANRPVVVRGAAKHWPAVRKWSPEFFRDEFGGAELLFMAGDKRYLTASSPRPATMSTFARRVLSTPASDEFYVVATNFALKEEPLSNLLQDIGGLSFVPELPLKDPNIVRLWFGPRGTITPLHHDVMNVIFVQVFGCKEYAMAPPFEIFRLYNQSGVYSDVDPAALDLQSFPLARELRWLRFGMGPGDALFIPVGWWHWVYASEVSISVNFADFEFANHCERWNE